MVYRVSRDSQGYTTKPCLKNKQKIKNKECVPETVYPCGRRLQQEESLFKKRGLQSGLICTCMWDNEGYLRWESTRQKETPSRKCSSSKRQILKDIAEVTLKQHEKALPTL